jgi:hypothetical protein
MSHLCVPPGTPTDEFNPLAIDWPDSLRCPGNWVDATARAGVGSGSTVGIGASPLSGPQPTTPGSPLTGLAQTAGATVPDISKILPKSVGTLFDNITDPSNLKGAGLVVAGSVLFLLGFVLWSGIGSKV